MKKTIFILTLIFAAVFLFSCDKQKKALSYKDGTYKGVSEIDEWGGCVKTDITVKDGKITECIMHNLTNKGEEKDDTYGMQDGKVKNEGLYKIAQNAKELSKEYPIKLIELQNVDDIDTLAGASVTIKSFQEAVHDALKDAVVNE